MKSAISELELKKSLEAIAGNHGGNCPYLMRHFNFSYEKASKIMDELESRGLVKRRADGVYYDTCDISLGKLQENKEVEVINTYKEEGIRILIPYSEDLAASLVPDSFHCTPYFMPRDYLQDLAFKGFLERFTKGDEYYSCASEDVEDEIYALRNHQAAYILIVWDAIRWAKEQGILVGPGRGNSARSIVNYCIGITDINPAKYNLQNYEYYPHDDGSLWFPDIDTNVELSRRDEIVDYMVTKYERFGAKAVPFPQFFEDDTRMKFDIIGVQILDELKASGIPLPHDCDDKATYEMLSAGDCDGVFELESPDVRTWLKLARPDNLTELTNLITLFRPGLHKFLTEYVSQKKPQSGGVEELFKSTHGIMTYQEQLIRFLMLLGFDNSHADKLLRKMQKRGFRSQHEAKDEVMEVAQKFLDGEVPAEIEPFVDTLYDNASCLYKQSHALGYAIMTYRHAYIKCHYPEIFRRIKQNEKV